MASYQKIGVGSQGESVYDLQRKLNSNGYNIAVDGVFGNETLGAVRDYQAKNNLSVDGVVGDQTWGSLNNAAQKSTGNVSGQTGDTTGDNTLRGVSDVTGAKLAEYEQGYRPSAAVAAAEKYLQEIQQKKPGAYVSPYAEQLQQMYDEIVNRKPFTYELNDDPVYRQYRDQYMAQGKRAMQDTVGQAAGLTGGYGSSYAENAGQQAYQTYLQQLNDRIPELQRQALERYEAESADMRQKYAMLGDREDTAYGRYRDELGDYRDDLAEAYQQYQNERGFDYGEYGDMLDYYRQKAAQENSDYWTQTQYDYQKARDAVADEQWAKQYALQQAQEARLAAAARGGSNGDEDDEETKVQKSLTKAIGNYESVKSKLQGYIDKGWTKGNVTAALLDAYQSGAILGADYNRLLQWVRSQYEGKGSK